jgi:hypothetical protein
VPAVSGFDLVPEEVRNPFRFPHRNWSPGSTACSVTPAPKKGKTGWGVSLSGSDS